MKDALSTPLATCAVAGWRDRLRMALDNSGRSARSVSLEAGLGHQYVNSLLHEQKDPSIERLAAVADAVGVSVSWLISGLSLDREAEEILQLLNAADPQIRQGLLLILRSASLRA